MLPWWFNGFFHRYPYTNYDEINLDELWRMLGEMSQQTGEVKTVAGISPDNTGNIPSGQLKAALELSTATGVSSNGFGFKRWGGFNVQGNFHAFQGMTYDYGRNCYYVTVPISDSDNCTLYVFNSSFEVIATYIIYGGSHGNDLTIGHDHMLYLAPILGNVLIRINPVTGEQTQITLPFISYSVGDVSYDSDNNQYWILNTLRRNSNWIAEGFITDTEFNVVKTLSLDLSQNGYCFIPPFDTYYIQGSFVEKGIFYIVSTNGAANNAGAPVKLTGFDSNGTVVSVGTYFYPKYYCEAEAVFVRGTGSNREIVIAGTFGSTATDIDFVILYPEMYSVKNGCYPLYTGRSYAPQHLYVDETAIECGDGRSISAPINDLELAMKIARYYSSPNIALCHDTVRTGEIRIANFDGRFQSESTEVKYAIKRKITFENGYVRMFDIKSTVQFSLLNTCAEFERCEFSTSDGEEENAIEIAANSKATLYNSVFTGNTNCVRASYGAMAVISGTCTGSNNTNFWNSIEAIMYSAIAAASLPATNEGTKTRCFVNYPT